MVIGLPSVLLYFLQRLPKSVIEYYTMEELLLEEMAIVVGGDGEGEGDIREGGRTVGAGQVTEMLD